jgi:glycosyltransferase involved in cell wall biosynthesis
MGQKIYYINRYSSSKRKQIRENSGYEQIIKYSNKFVSVKSNKFISRLIIKLFGKNKPADYITITAWQEIVIFFKSLFTGYPIFYLYADKDAFILPLLKRKFNVKRIKVYGTLHWPKEISSNYAFYKFNLESEFNGVITLSSSLSKSLSTRSQIIPHGINSGFWRNDTIESYDNYYLIIGISNRNHQKQIDIIKEVIVIDSNAHFKVLISHKETRELYSGIKNVKIIDQRIDDQDLKKLYLSAKAIILFQNYCLASNVVLEAMAMGIPLITNNVGDVSEYLGSRYDLYINSNNDFNKLEQIIKSDKYRYQISEYLLKRIDQYNWPEIATQTTNFINNCND